PLTLDEQAKLFRKSNIASKLLRPSGGGKPFRGYRGEWIVEALREHGTAAPPARLRLVAPAETAEAVAPVAPAPQRTAPRPSLVHGMPPAAAPGSRGCAKISAAPILSTPAVYPALLRPGSADGNRHI